MFKTSRAEKNYLKDNRSNSLHSALRSWRTVHSSEQVMSAEKYLGTFSRQTQAIVQIDRFIETSKKDNNQTGET